MTEHQPEIVSGLRKRRGQLEWDATGRKRAGLITTFTDDRLLWVRFTAKGVALAAANGIVILEWDS